MLEINLEILDVKDDGSNNFKLYNDRPFVVISYVDAQDYGGGVVVMERMYPGFSSGNPLHDVFVANNEKNGVADLSLIRLSPTSCHLENEVIFNVPPGGVKPAYVLVAEFRNIGS